MRFYEALEEYAMGLFMAVNGVPGREDHYTTNKRKYNKTTEQQKCVHSVCI